MPAPKPRATALATALTAMVGGTTPALAGFDAEPADNINGRSIKAFVSSECGGCHNPKRTGATGPSITKKRLRHGIKNDEGDYKTSDITGRPLTPFNEQARSDDLTRSADHRRVPYPKQSAGRTAEQAVFCRSAPTPES